MAKPFKTLSIKELESIVREAGLSPFRSQQILDWVYAKNATSYDEMVNLPKVIREQFDLAFPLYTPTIADKQVSKDKSRKYLLEFEDGTVVETVGLPSEDGRLTVCCSSQAGCAMKCAFCATGKNGLVRDLAPGEIVDQVLVVQRDFERPVTNVVVMGQGEPFANYEAVLAALRILNHHKLVNIGARHITVSTCGLINGIERLSHEPEQFTLAVSLHAARQDVRDTLMLAVKNQDLKSLRRALIDYSKETGRRFSFEYALMQDVNDGEEDLAALVEYCKGLLCHVNLIPLNEIEGSDFKPTSKRHVEYWNSQLEAAGIAVSTRKSRGADIAGACGQLANKHLS